MGGRAAETNLVAGGCDVCFKGSSQSTVLGHILRQHLGVRGKGALMAAAVAAGSWDNGRRLARLLVEFSAAAFRRLGEAVPLPAWSDPARALVGLSSRCGMGYGQLPALLWRGCGSVRRATLPPLLRR